MNNTRQLQQGRMETSKKGSNRYIQLIVLFCLLLCWKFIFLISHPLGLTWANFLAYCWIFGVMIFYLKVTDQSFVTFFSFISMRAVLYGIGIGFLLFIFGGLGNFLSQKIFGLGLPQDITQIFSGLAGYTFLFTMIITVISEEILFRGILLKGLYRDLSAFWAVLISALFFSLFHLSLFNAISTFIYGIVLGTVTLRSGNLWPALVGHFTLNIIGIVMFTLA